MRPQGARTIESNALDAEILAVIAAWHRDGVSLAPERFDDLALRIFTHQLRYNTAYARYCSSKGISLASLPHSWEAIPPVPAAAFKETALTTFDAEQAALAFETSGTTSGVGGRHFMETTSLYDGALLAGFDRFMLPDQARLRYLNLVPNPADRPQSSLGYMMERISRLRGDDCSGWYVRGDALFFDRFIADARIAAAQGQPVCIAATAFSLTAVLDEMESHAMTVACAPGSRVMETGGFKGRAKVVDRAELYVRACECLGVPRDAIVAEYGMTELTSQYYDAVGLRPAADLAVRQKVGPPWLRARIVGPDGAELPNGTVGALAHVDLANRSSCLAIVTEDLGVRFPTSAGFVLIGREQGAALRGCSLDAEELLSRAG